LQPILSFPVIKTRDAPNVVVSGQVQNAYDVVSHALKQSNAIPDFVVGSKHESIVYTKNRRNQYAKANLCLHTRNTFGYGDPGASGFYCLATTPNPDWEWKFYQTHNRQCCDIRDTILGLAKTALGGTFGPAHLGGSGQAYMNTTFDRLRPDLTELSVPNFLADIDDITNLFRLWRKSKSLARNLAGANLNLNFGWKPTIGDIQAATEGVLRLKEHIAEFEAKIGQTIQKSTNLLQTSNSVSTTYRLPGAGLYSYTATVTRKVDGYIAYKPMPLLVLNSVDKAIRSYLDVLGVELNPRILWDALPFTFVIDWFFGVGNLLSRYKWDALELPIYLVDGFLQYKEKLHIEWKGVSDHLTGYVPFPRSAGATWDCEFFHRMPIYPDYAQLTGLGWKMPTLNQASLLVDLGVILSKSKRF